jgi:membrane protein
MMRASQSTATRARHGVRSKAATRKRLAQLFKAALDEFFDDGCPQRAASISYYALLAMFPLAILSVAVFGIFVSGAHARRQVVDFLLSNLPLNADKGRSDLQQLLIGVTQNTATVGVVGAAGLVFSASGLMTAIRLALNAAWERTQDTRPPVQGKLLDVVLVLATGLFILLSLALSVAIRLAVQLGGNGSLAGAADALLDAAQVVPTLLSFGAFIFLYRVVPEGHTRLRDIWIGALVAAVGVELAKTGFSFYLANFGNYNAVYGSIGAVIAFLVFAWVTANFFLFGAELASEWPGIRDATPEELEGDGAGLKARLRGLFVRR